MSSPLVSIIVAAKNAAKFLSQALDSVFAQSYQNFELLLINGGSTDRTLEIAKSYKNIQIIEQHDKGIANAYNLGINNSKGELVAFLSSDDIWKPNKLVVQVNFLIDHPKIAFTTAHTEFFLEPGSAMPEGFRKNLLIGSHPAHIMETLVAHKKIFEKVGLFNADLFISEDIDWFARARDLQIPFALMPETLLSKRVHDNNISLKDKNNKNLLLALRKSIERKKNIQNK